MKFANCGVIMQVKDILQPESIVKNQKEVSDIGLTHCEGVITKTPRKTEQHYIIKLEYKRSGATTRSV